MKKFEIKLPSGYDWEYFFRDTLYSREDSELTQKDRTRIERLVDEALSRCGKPHIEYEIFGKQSKKFIDSYYGLQVHDEERVCIIFTSERRRQAAISIYPINDLHLAAEYLVSLVSDNESKIDWSLYLEGRTLTRLTRS